MNEIELRNFSTNVFNIFNGNINQLNTKLDLRFVYGLTESENNVAGRFCFPDVLKIYNNIINIAEDYINTIIIITIIHELYHADQFYIENYNSQQIEFDVEFMTYTYILNHKNIILSIDKNFNFDFVKALLNSLYIKNPTCYPMYNRIDQINYIVKIISTITNLEYTIKIMNDISYIINTDNFIIKFNITKLGITDTIVINNRYPDWGLIDMVIDFAKRNLINKGRSEGKLSISYIDNVFIIDLVEDSRLIPILEKIDR